MRTYLFLLFLSICSSFSYGQDYVRLLDGTHYEAVKIAKIDRLRIWFKPYGSNVSRQLRKNSISSFSENGDIHVVDTTVIKVPTNAERAQAIENLRAKLMQKKEGSTTRVTAPEIKTQEALPVTYFSDNAPKDKNALYNSGTQDAYQYYKGYKGAGTGTYLTTFLLSPVGGLITAIATSSTPPREQNLMYPDHELWKTGSYQSGYKNEAGKIKRRKVWKNFGVGLASWVGFVVITSALANR